MTYRSTPFHGKLARVEKGDTATGYGAGWNIAITLAMADASRQGQQWREQLPGQGQWGGDFDVYFTPGNTEQKAFADNIIAATPGTKLTDVKFLLEDATHAFSGNIFITGFSLRTSLGAVVGANFTFDGDGAPTLTDGA